MYWPNTNALLVAGLDRILSWAATSIQRLSVSCPKVVRFHCSYVPMSVTRVGIMESNTYHIKVEVGDCSIRMPQSISIQ